MTRTYDQFCPVALSLDVLGDRWTLPVLRDLLWHGPQRFNELLEPNPGLSSALLSGRLTRLVEQGLVERTESGTSGASHYRLTLVGRRVEPVIAALYEFGAPLLTEASITDETVAYIVRRSAIDNPERLWDISDTTAVSLVVADATVNLVAGPGTLRVIPKSRRRIPLRLRMTSTAFIDLVSGRSSPAALLDAGEVQVGGDHDQAERVLEVLHRQQMPGRERVAS